MPGFPGLAIGAGLGQFEQQYQQQQAQREREQMLRLTLAKFQQEQQDRQSNIAGADVAASYLAGGNNTSSGGGMPFAPQMPAQQPASSPASGGGAHWTPAGITALQPTEGRWDQVHYPSGRAPSGVKSSASGGLGYLDGTWREFAPKAGVDLNQFPRAYMAPEDVQRKVAAITPASHWTGNDKNGKPFNAAAQRLAENPAYITGAGVQPSPGQPQNLLGGGGAQGGPQAGVGAPPPAYDPATVAAAIKRDHPGLSNVELVKAVQQVGAFLGPKAKDDYARWSKDAELYYRGRGADTADASQKETASYHKVEAGLAGQRIAGESEGRAETKRSHLATEAETKREHDLLDKSRGRVFDAKQAAAKGKTDTATLEMKTLSSRARDLMAAVEQNPNLVGVRGRGARMFGGAAEQAKFKQEDEASAAFLSELNILKAGLQASKFQGARYFSKAAMDQLSALVPGEGALDNPTKVKSALRALADRLDEKVTEVGATSQGVGTDYQHLGDQDILQQLGITPGQQ